MGKFRLFLFVILAALLTVSVGFAAEHNAFTAKITGQQSVPAVKTKARGEAMFNLSKDGKELSDKLAAHDIANVTAAHIHLGRKGESGPPLAGLFAGPEKKGTFSGILAEGKISDKELLGNLAGKSLGDLVKLIREGKTYVNVHTVAHPDGEIRGQIR